MLALRLFSRLIAGAALAGPLVLAAAPLELGSRRELFVDDYLIERRLGLELRLHHPVAKEVVLVRDAPWEGSGSDFEVLLHEPGLIRMYYMGAELTNADGTKLQFDPVTGGKREVYACYAESKDGIHWTKPNLGLFEFHGSKDNNIVWSAPQLDNFTPFKDPNPDCRPGERYKAMSAGPGGLYALKSDDGIHWSRLAEQPVVTTGKFDTQNNAFWDPVRRHYWCYVRSFHGPDGKPTADTKTGVRDILVATSKDFLHWSEPELLRYPGAPDEALYTNAIQPYYRAPHLFVGFPARYVDRPFPEVALQALPDPEHRARRMQFSRRYGTVVTDGLFMSSRDGRTFHRWGEAFVRPGPQRRDNWVYGDGFVALGLFEQPGEDPTAEPELTLYYHDDHWKGPTRLRRYRLRVDGFVSLQAPLAGGELISKPLTFTGRTLSLNFSTSAAGGLRVELQDEAGRPLPGFSLAEADVLFGDTLARTASWHGSADVSSLAGRVVRLRVALSDADLYSFQFQP